MYEAPFNPLPASVNAGWGFQRSSLWPTISAYGNLGAATPNMVTSFDIILLTPFVFSTAKYPTPTTTISTYLQAGRPIFFAAKVFGSYHVKGAPGLHDINNYWETLAVLGVNTFTTVNNPRPLFYEDVHGAGVYQLSGLENLFISDFLHPAFGRLVLRQTGNVYGYVAIAYNQQILSFRPDLFQTVDLTLSPAYSKIDLANDFTYMVLFPDAAHPIPTQIQFTANTAVTGAGAYYGVQFSLSDVSNAFDINVNWSNGSTAPMQAFNSGHIMWSTGTNSLTPAMPGTVAVLTQEFNEYWLINLVPMTSKAASMIYDNVGHAAGWRITRDINGIWYFGSNFDNRFILTSFGLHLPFDWPQALLPTISLPCYGSCVPVPLNIPQL